MKKRTSILIYLALTVAGVFLSFTGAQRATEARGYYAIGGEWLFLFLPLMYYIIEKTVKDIIQLIRTTDFTEDYEN